MKSNQRVMTGERYVPFYKLKNRYDAENGEYFNTVWYPCESECAGRAVEKHISRTQSGRTVVRSDFLNSITGNLGRSKRITPLCLINGGKELLMDCGCISHVLGVDARTYFRSKTIVIQNVYLLSSSKYHKRFLRLGEGNITCK